MEKLRRMKDEKAGDSRKMMNDQFRAEILCTTRSSHRAQSSHGKSFKSIQNPKSVMGPHDVGQGRVELVEAHQPFWQRREAEFRLAGSMALTSFAANTSTGTVPRRRMPVLPFVIQGVRQLLHHFGTRGKMSRIIKLLHCWTLARARR